MMTKRQKEVAEFKGKASFLYDGVVNCFQVRDGYFVEGDHMKFWRFDSVANYRTWIKGNDVYSVFTFESYFSAN